MSVIVKGMKMPTACSQCPLFQEHDVIDWCGYGCKKISRKITFKPDWCPLVEIKPHGRLIDKTELEKEVCAGCDSDCYGCAIGRAPTIIEEES